MIVRMNNKDSKFYTYMGKQFGSRAIQNKTGDRIYDDDSKEWYIYLKDNKVCGFVSVNKNIIKNVYAVKESYLKELLNKVNKDIVIMPSVVTNIYVDVYKNSKFIVSDSSEYKNFVIITSLQAENVK